MYIEIHRVNLYASVHLKIRANTRVYTRARARVYQQYFYFLILGKTLNN